MISYEFTQSTAAKSKLFKPNTNTVTYEKIENPSPSNVSGTKFR